MSAIDNPGEHRLTRRTLLAGAAAGAVALSLPGRVRTSVARPISPRPFSQPLRIPEQLTGSELTIPMHAADVEVLPGRPTRMWTYGGSFPGPTVRRPAGETTRVRFDHRLGPRAGELTVHLHGGHNRASEDGQPGGLTARQPRSLYCDITPGLSPAESGNDLLIAPGGSRTYNYEQVEDGQPERASFQWYHDHRLDHTARNVWRGLAGMWIVDDELDAALPLPRGRRDIPLMLADRSFDKHNQLTDPFAGGGLRPPDDGVAGRHILVNGVVLPHHDVRPQRYRLRVLNASQFRSYSLCLTGGVKLVQIATEGGLLPRPLPRRAVLIGPGERAELIVDFAQARGERVQLVSVPRRRAPNRLGSQSYAGPLMEFRVGSRQLRDATSIPAALRPLPAWVAAAPATPSHAWRLTVGLGLRPSWLINGRTYDPGHADVSVPLGEVVTWELHNRTAAAHLMHLHHTDWYMLARNGRRPPPWERCLKDTFFLDPGDRVLIAGKLSDYPGRYVVHCHMLDHEDHGLMSQFEVTG